MDANNEFTCTICLTNPKRKGHLMCSDCMTGPGGYEDYVVEMLELGKPHESKFQYARRRTQDNLNKLREELDELKFSEDAFWGEAYKEIKRECRTRLDKNRFMSAVWTRYDFLLEKAGCSEIVERMKSLRKNLDILRQQMEWFARIEQEKQAKAARKENVILSKETAETAA